MRTRRFHRLLPLAILLIAVILAGAVKTFFWRRAPSHGMGYYNEFNVEVPHQPPGVHSEAEITGSVSGRVVDENDSPIYFIDVTMFPVGATGETRHQGTTALEGWTNKEGVYQFSSLKRGEYLLGVGARGAPTGERPFFASYYPGVEGRRFAERVRVQGNTKIELRTMRLRRMQTATIKIHVRWQDGTPVEASNLLFHNTSFSQGVIGDTAPQIDKGEGEFVVPLGYEYYARAGVWCDGGSKIDMRESEPVQHLRIDSAHIPQELTFVMQSQPCKRWTPRN